MKRRLYYLLPDLNHTKQFCRDLQSKSLNRQDIHILSQSKLNFDEDIDTQLERNVNDTDLTIEWFLWRLDIVLFIAAFSIFLIMISASASYWIALPSIAMALFFILGYELTQKEPNVHLNEFHDALSHGEILVMADTPVNRMNQLNRQMKNQHPEATIGGSCWHFN